VPADPGEDAAAWLGFIDAWLAWRARYDVALDWSRARARDPGGIGVEGR